MDSVMLGAQLLLATALGVAGVAKLGDLPGSRQAMADFGVPARAVSPTAVLVPVAEILTSVALMVQGSARAGAVAALVLLLAFSSAIAVAMLRGRAPDCHCFGQIHSSPAGWGALARNGFLGLMAAAIAWRGPGPAIEVWLAQRTSSELAAIGLGIAAVIAIAVAWRLWSENRALQSSLAAARSAADPESRREGLLPGAPAPDFTLADVQGGAQTLGSLQARGKPILLEFIHPGCGPCKALLPILARWQATLGDRVTIAVVTSASEGDRLVWEEHGVSNVLLDPSNGVFDSFRIRSTPTAVAITPDGTIASAPAGGMHMPEVLVRLILRGAIAAEPSRDAEQDGPLVISRVEPRLVV